MQRVRFITHKGKQVLLLDYSHLADEAEMVTMVEERKRLITAQPRNSVLKVADLTGARPTRNALTKIKEANVYEQPYVVRAALVGVDAHQKTQVESVETFSHHHHERFATLAEALDWIVEEPEGTKKAGSR